MMKIDERSLNFVCKICGKKADYNDVIEMDFCLEHGFDLIIEQWNVNIKTILTISKKPLKG